jgi:hypothetical protein
MFFSESSVSKNRSSFWPRASNGVSFRARPKLLLQYKLYATGLVRARSFFEPTSEQCGGSSIESAHQLNQIRISATFRCCETGSKSLSALQEKTQTASSLGVRGFHFELILINRDSCSSGIARCSEPFPIGPSAVRRLPRGSYRSALGGGERLVPSLSCPAAIPRGGCRKS